MSVSYSLWYVNIDVFVYDYGLEGWCIFSPLEGGCGVDLYENKRELTFQVKCCAYVSDL